ncbi:MAG: hypothetical protein KBT27_02650 [Prevotellaceae bacterium]|nr:hypothetical protein [Candidatus Faecinaster equi]
MIDQNTKIIMSYRELEFHDKQIIKEFVNEADKYIGNYHVKCEDCDFTYKTCFSCFYHTEWLKEQKNDNI